MVSEGIGVRPTQLTLKQSSLQKFILDYDLFQNLHVMVSRCVKCVGLTPMLPLKNGIFDKGKGISRRLTSSSILRSTKYLILNNRCAIEFSNILCDFFLKLDELVKSRKLPLPFIPSHQGRGNMTFYECIKVIKSLLVTTHVASLST